MALEMDFESEISLSAIKLMICLRFSFFRFLVSGFCPFLSASSSFIDAISSKTKWMPEGQGSDFLAIITKVNKLMQETIATLDMSHPKLSLDKVEMRPFVPSTGAFSS